jgi:lipid-A-disaccharide synthase
MKPKSVMFIAGEASGDLLGAELARALREELADAEGGPTTDYQPLRGGLEPRFFGAGGPRMAAAGVRLAFDLTAHSVIGLSDVVRHYATFRRLFGQLLRLARERQPEAIVCVDFSGFNSRFARAVKRYARARRDWFHDWDPKLIQYVSPQVWASRAGRARQLARDCDLLLSIFPFERAWYAARVPGLPVEFVGHPLVDRYQREEATRSEGTARPGQDAQATAKPTVVLLPGSRRAELKRHLPVVLEAARRLAAAAPVSFRMVLPNESLAQYARPYAARAPGLEVQVGGLAAALARADLALTKSGTVTLECAFFGVPAVVFYKTSLSTYLVGKRLVKVKYLAMPNLLADAPVFPEFIQGAATGERLAGAARELLCDAARRAEVKRRLTAVVASLGPPGAARRAAKAIAWLLGETKSGNTR